MKQRQEIPRLRNRREGYDEELRPLRTQLLNYKNFRGRVILVFNFIEARTVIEKLFDVTWGKRFIISVFKRYFKDYYFRGHRMEIRVLPEPQDLIFDNLHYSKINRRIRAVLAYSLGFMLMTIVTGSFGAQRYYSFYQ